MIANTQSISNALGVTYSVVEPVGHSMVAVNVDAPELERAESDYEFGRRNIIDVIEKGQGALDDMIDFARQAREPRAFEVVGQLIDKIVVANEKLLNLSKQIKDVKKEELKNEAPGTINNNLVITSAELLKMLREEK